MRKITFMGVLNFLIALCAIAILIIALTSCGSRKKVLKKTDTRIEQREEVREEVKESEVVEKQLEKKEVEKQEVREDTESFSGEIADPSLPATVTREEKNGISTVIYTNFRNISSGVSVSASKKETEKETHLSEKTERDVETDMQSGYIEKRTEREKDVASERKESRSAWWIVPGLVLLLFLVFVYYYFRPFR